MDVISNNLANINTTGFKQARAGISGFALSEPIAGRRLHVTGDQLSLRSAKGHWRQCRRDRADRDAGQPANRPATRSTSPSTAQGYFQILLPSGQVAYTRDGSFQLNAQGQVVNALGYSMQPPITIPRGAHSITVGTDGTVSVQVARTRRSRRRSASSSSPISSTRRACRTSATIWRPRPRPRARRSPVSRRRTASARSRKAISKARTSRSSTR